MRQIFISYARKDNQEVDKVVRYLEERGFNIWIDRTSLAGGDTWRKALVDAIENCGDFIIFLSTNSINSKNVQRELEIAADAGKHIVPILLEDIIIPSEMKFALAGIQWIDIYSNFQSGLPKILYTLGEGISYWQQEDFETIDELVIPHLSNGNSSTIEEFIIELDRATKKNSNEWILFYVLGDKYQSVGLYNKAMEAIKRAMEIREDDLRSTYALATAYNLFTRAQWTAVDASFVQEIVSTFLETNIDIIDPELAREELNKTKLAIDTAAAQAIRWFEKCLDLNPDAQSRQFIQEDLDALYTRYPHLKLQGLSAQVG